MIGERARRAVLRATLVAVALAAYPSLATDAPGARSATAPPDLKVGVIGNSLDAATGPTQDAVVRLGAGWIREELRWSEAEPSRGRFAWARFDGVMLDAARRHLHVLPLLIRSPRWLTAHPMMLPPVLTRWQRFVRAATGRYEPGGTFWRAHPRLDARLAPVTWEIWNEPYLRQFSYPAPDPARYAALVRATVQAGRRVSSRLRFIAAAETVYATRTGRIRPWIDALFAAVPRLGSYLDGVAVHPYPRRSPDDARAPRDARFERIDDIVSALAAHGLAKVPVWITEIGWSTCTARPPCVLPATQGRYLKRMFGLLENRYRSTVAAVFVYRLGDIDRSRPADPESGFGLMTVDGRRKPAWSVVARAAARLR
jgi:hypothetical protein